MPRRRQNTQSFTRDADDGRQWQHMAARRGYQDACAGLGFSEWYNTATRDEQLAYEVGRQWVTDMRAAKIAPPSWMRAGAPPTSVQEANVLARERGEGYATPWGVLPDTSDPVELEPLGVRIRGRKRRR